MKKIAIIILALVCVASVSYAEPSVSAGVNVGKVKEGVEKARREHAKGKMNDKKDKSDKEKSSPSK